jgi:hypothetical protein
MYNALGTSPPTMSILEKGNRFKPEGGDYGGNAFARKHAIIVELAFSVSASSIS